MDSDVRRRLIEDLRAVLDRLEANRTRVRIPRFVPGRRALPDVPVHGHAEFFFQTGGATDFACPGEAFRLRTRELAVIPRGMPHAETPIDLRTAYSILVIYHAGNGLRLRRCRSDAARRIRGYESAVLPGARVIDALRHLDEAARAHELPADLRRAYVRVQIGGFLMLLLGELAITKPAVPTASPLIHGAETLVLSRLGDPDLTVTRVARELRCSPEHLSRQYRAERGLTLKSWILRERLLLADDLLRHSRANVAEVGWACGFKTPAYFSRVFHAHRGTTPRAFRKAQTPVV